MSALSICRRRGRRSSGSKPAGFEFLKAGSIRRGCCRALAVFVLVMGSVTAWAQAHFEDQYKESLTQSKTINPMLEFGDSVNLRDGTLSFKNTDIVVPGTGPTIKLVRTAIIQDGMSYNALSRNRIGGWELEIPRIQTVVARPSARLRGAQLAAESPSGWQVSNSDKDARCTKISPPSGVEYPELGVAFESQEWWTDYVLVDGDGNTRPLVIRDPALPGAASLIGTMDHWVVQCLPSTSDPVAAPGEAFLAISPDGVKYWFDYLVYDSYDSYIKSFSEIPPDGATMAFTLPRQLALMYVTRVEDRFGNWIKYSYVDGFLTSIDASDGRRVVISRAGNIEIKAGSGPAARSWVYRFDIQNYSLVVVNPDGSSWNYAGDYTRGSLSNYSFANCDQNYLHEPTETRSLFIQSPSGAVASFELKRMTFGRSFAPKFCYTDVIPNGPVSLDEISSATIARLWTAFALQSRVVSGPGVAQRTWKYTYSPNNGCWDPAVAGNLTNSVTICNANSPTVVWTDRTDPDGSRLRSVFSNRYDQSENKLLQELVYTPGGQLLQTTNYAYAYATRDSQNPYLFPMRPGIRFSSRINSESEERWAPLRMRQIIQQGRSFTWEVAAECGSSALCFDVFGRPTKITRMSTP